MTVVVSVFKKLTKIGEFLWNYCNIEDGRKYTFEAYYVLFQERLKRNWNAKKIMQCVEKVLGLIECVKVVWGVSWSYRHFGQTILCCGDVLYIKRCLAAPLASPPEVEVAGILKISKSIKDWWKWKISFILWNKLNGHFGQLNIILIGLLLIQSCS